MSCGCNGNQTGGRRLRRRGGGFLDTLFGSNKDSDQQITQSTPVPQSTTLSMMQPTSVQQRRLPFASTDLTNQRLALRPPTGYQSGYPAQSVYSSRYGGRGTRSGGRKSRSGRKSCGGKKSRKHRKH